MTIVLIGGKHYRRFTFKAISPAVAAGYAAAKGGWVAGTYNTGTIVYVPVDRGA